MAEEMRREDAETAGEVKITNREKRAAEEEVLAELYSDQEGQEDHGDAGDEGDQDQEEELHDQTNPSTANNLSSRSYQNDQVKQKTLNDQRGQDDGYGQKRHPKAQEAWFSDANDALLLTLTASSSKGPKDLATFHPKFTYSIFGEDERIFGYKDLKIQVRFRANDMRPHLHVSSSARNDDESQETTDIIKVLQEDNYLPQVAYTDQAEFEAAVQQLRDDWTPPGTLHRRFNMPDGDYEIWRGKLTCPRVRSLVNNSQFLVPLFIEGGTYICSEQDDEFDEPGAANADRWTVWFLFKRQPSTFAPDKTAYTFIGFATVYRFFLVAWNRKATNRDVNKDWELPRGAFNNDELPCRSRLSQFLILPPYQGEGKGSIFYKTIFEYYHNHPQTREITVEAPNEAFDDLRDCCDLVFLRKLPEFEALRFNTDVIINPDEKLPTMIFGQDDLDIIRSRSKIAPRQFARLLEMHLMSQLPKSVRPTMDLEEEHPEPTAEDKKLQQLWSLFVKRRLYFHNKDVLAQISPSERKVKLHETLGGVALEYAKMLAATDRAAMHDARMSAEPSARGKRKLEDAMARDADPMAGKKTRV